MLSTAPYSKFDIKTLVNKCIDRDPLAWSEFIIRFSPLAYRAIRKRLENHGFQFNKQDLEDLKQGFFMKLWHENSIEKVKNLPDINYWICLVAANFATDFYRRSKKDILKGAVSIFEEVVINNKKIALKNYVKSNTSMPGKMIDKKLLNENAENLFSGLNPKEKIAFELNIYHNKKYREISKILKLPTGSVSYLISAAKQKIRKKFQQNG